MNLDFKNYTLLSPEEHLKLLKIRNLDYVRKNMKNDSVILLNDHLSWVDKLSEDNTKKYYALFLESTLVGGINITDIDHINESSSWGLFMQANMNPMVPSIATYVIIEKIFNSLGIRTLNLEVNKLNTNAYKFDRNFGFIDNGEYKDGMNAYYLMTMNKEDWLAKKNIGLLNMIKKQIDKSNIKFYE